MCDEWKKILVDYCFIFSLIQDLYPSVVTPAASHTLTSEGQNKRAEPLQITVGDDDDGGGDDDDDDDNADVVVERQEEKKENNNEQKVLNKILEYGIVKWKNGQGSKRKERRKKVKTWDKAQ